MVKFMDIPPSKNKTGLYKRSAEIDADVEELKKHPGKPALLIENWRSNGHSGYRSRGVMCTSRKNGDGTWNVYGWWPTEEEIAWRNEQAVKQNRRKKK